MPLIQSSVSIAANVTLENALAGSQFEFLPYNSFLEFGLAGSAAGLVADVYSGQDVLSEGSTIAPVNRIPVYPDDFNLNDAAAQGERIKVKIRNTTGGALTAFWSVRITPI